MNLLQKIFLFISVNFTIINSASITGSLSVPNEYKQQNPDTYMDIFYKDVIVHLQGTPGTSKLAHVTYKSGTFSFNNIEPGHSYILSAESSNIRYKEVRVDVNKNGNIRVREADRVDTSRVSILPTPIKLQPLGKPNFFHIRQKINIVGMIMGNPMMLLMGVSAILMFVMPKMVDMNDPEVKKEMENNMSMFSGKNNNGAQAPNMDVAEMMNNFFGGGAQQQGGQSKKKKN